MSNSEDISASLLLSDRELKDLLKPFNEPLLNKLRSIRKQAKLNLAQISKKTGFGISEISSWERGEQIPSQPQLERLLAIYQREIK